MKLKKKAGGFNFLLIIVFILPLITFAITIYTIYLKNEMNFLAIQINDLGSDYITSQILEIDNNQDYYEKELILPELQVGKVKANVNYNVRELNYQFLLSNSVTLLKSSNVGAVKIFDNERKAFEEALYALENGINYFIFKNGNKYYLYRQDYDLVGAIEEQYLYTIQIYLFNSPALAVFPTMALREGGIPAVVYNGKYTPSNADYWSIVVGLFETGSESDEYMKNMEEQKVFELTGLGIKDRFRKAIHFTGKNE